LKAEAEKICGVPEKPKFSDEIVAVIKWVDGTVIDSVKKSDRLNSSGLTIHQILLKYWGYSSFRPLQEEIIQSVLDGRDTLALYPPAEENPLPSRFLLWQRKGCASSLPP
jgi:hypothetical protein